MANKTYDVVLSGLLPPLPLGGTVVTVGVAVVTVGIAVVTVEAAGVKSVILSILD